MVAGHVDPKTLDISEPQIIQHFDGGDSSGTIEFCYRSGVWIGLSPDGDLARIDLNQVQTHHIGS